ncbi:MAG TPA: potassium channel family protein [Pyrinomonadaceae bacterium]|jgi:voltage-gated potassium channel Kch
MATFIYTAAGFVLLSLIIFDIYATVLHSSARYGPVGESLNRSVWRVTRAAAFRLSRANRHRLLNMAGPLLLPLLIVVYIVLLVLAFALIYYPHVPSGFTFSVERGEHGWADAIYFSGVTLTTAGYGDVVPRLTSLRLLALVESASGLVVISLAITYMLTVYTALERKRSVALSLYHQAGEGADVAGLIAHHFVEGRFYGLRDALRTVTRDLQAMLESHIDHPVIHYFHPVEVYKSTPRVLFLLLETCTVIRSALDREENQDLRNYPEVRTLEAGVRHVLAQLIDSLDLERRARPRRPTEREAEEDSRRWRRRYEQTVARLRETGITTRADSEQGWEEFREQREEWESKLRRLAIHLGYDWEEVTGDRDLEYASDEGKKEPKEP